MLQGPKKQIRDQLRQRGRSCCLVVGLLAVLLGGGALLWHAYVHQQGRMQHELLVRTVQGARGVDPQKVAALTGTEADLDSAAYRRLKNHLTLLRENQPDVRFIYLMRQRSDGEVIILVDSEPATSPDYSPPGDVFYEAGPDEARFFATGEPRVFPPEEDRWGRWVSAYAPIRDPDTGRILALFGMDIDASDWQHSLYRSLRWPLLLILVLGVVILMACRLVARATQGQRSSWIMAYGEFLIIGCLGGLLTAYATWVAHDLGERRYFRLFSQLADSKLDRVQQRLEQMRDYSLPFVARYVDISLEFDPQEFGKVVEPFLDRPGDHSWGWVAAVPHDKREIVESRYAEWMGEIWEKDEAGNRRPVSDRPVYYPLKAIFPVELYGDALGFDLGSETNRAAMIATATELRQPTASLPLELFTTGPDRRVLMIVQPVFAQPERESLRGFIISPLNVEQFMRRMWPSTRLHFSVQMVQPGGEEVLQFSNCPSPDHPFVDQQLVRYVGIFGQVFKIATHPGPLFYAAYPRRDAIVTAMVGLLLTAMVALLLGTPLREKRNLKKLVAQRTLNLEETEQRYEILAQRSRTVLWEIDSDGCYTALSTNVEDVFGYTPDELVGRKFIYELAPGDDRAALEAHVMELMRTGHTDHDYENQVETKAGEVRWVSTTAMPKHDAAGRLVGFVGWDRDIHTRKCAEQEKDRLLAEAEESRRMLLKVIEDQQQTESERARLATAIEQSPDTVVITDVSGTIQYVNPAFERVTGYTADEAIGQNPRILKSGEQEDAFYTEMWHTIAQGQVWSGKVVNRAKDGHLFTEEATISPVRNENGEVTHFVAIKRDITDELERERMYQQAQKMNSIGRLAGGIAHDFNNMLQVILGNTELAMEGAGDNGWLKQDLEQVKNAAKRSVELTRQLLAFASRQSVKPQVVDLKAVVPDLLGMLRRLMDASIKLDWVPGEGQAQIKIDPSQLDQILVNLCVNARDAITERGNIQIGADRVYLSGRELFLGEYPVKGEYVVLSVTDNGCGMDEELTRQVFEPFFTTKAKGQGVGLGLSTVYGIVRQNGGYVEVDSTAGQGTAFRLYFPVCDGPGVEVLEGASAVVTDQQGTGILIVEDEASILNLTERTLQRAGFTVWSTASPKEALQLVDQHKDEIHLLLTDVIMPEMNGKELADQVVQKCPSIKCLFMSGYSEEVIARNGIVPEHMNFLQKPFTAEAMSVAIQDALSSP